MGQDAGGIDVGELSNGAALPPQHLRRLAYQRDGRLVQVGVDHDQRVQTTLGRSPSRHTERLDTAVVVEGCSFSSAILIPMEGLGFIMSSTIVKACIVC